MGDDEIVQMLSFNNDGEIESNDESQDENHQNININANVIVTNHGISQDQTTVLFEGTADIQQVLLESKKHRKELCAKGPRLPDGKEAHLFVSYSGNDCDRVFPIVAELERTFGVACLLADRDFHSGKKILENIEDGMEKSVKVLLFLSNNFLKSGYCKHERELACVMSLEHGENIIIPILLEECDIPSTLKTLTYIDAQKEQHTLTQRIVDDYNNSDRSNDVLPLHFSRASQKLENGYFIDLHSKQDTSCIGRPAVKYIEIDSSVKKKIADSKILLSDKLLEQVVLKINQHYATEICLQMDNCFPFCLACSFQLIVTVVGFFIIAVAYVHQVGIKTPSQAAVNLSQGYMNVSILMAMIMPFCSLVICCTYGVKYVSRKWAISELDKIVYNFYTTATYKEHVLLSVRRVRQGCCGEHMSLRLIRYNLKACEAYLSDRLSNSQEYLESDVAPEDMAQTMILSYLKTFLAKDGGDIDSLPYAPENRHNVKGGKKCVCQLLEDQLHFMVPDSVVVVS